MSEVPEELKDYKYPVILGTTRKGRQVGASLFDFQGVNLIVGKKGTGKSHEAKTILLSLINNGAKCIVLDINDEYSALRRDENFDYSRYDKKIWSVVPREKKELKFVEGKPAITYEVMKFQLKDIGWEAFSSTLSTMGLSDIAMFELGKGWEKLSEDNRLTWSAFQKEGPKYISNSRTQGAAMRRLTMIDRMKLMTDNEEEALDLEAMFKTGQNYGRALVVDLRGQGRLEMKLIVRAILAKLQDLLVLKKIDPIFLFAEEAHLYLDESEWVDVVTRVRHLALWQFYMTNSPTKIPDLVVRQADNLFSFHLDLKEDIRHIAPAAGMDEESVELMSKSLPPRMFLAVGECTSDYPVIMNTIKLPVQAAGKTRLFFTRR